MKCTKSVLNSNQPKNILIANSLPTLPKKWIALLPVNVTHCLQISLTSAGEPGNEQYDHHRTEW